MTEQAINNREQMQGIRRRMLSGAITYEQAKAEATPLIEAINAQAKVIAKKHNVKASRVSFAAIMR